MDGESFKLDYEYVQKMPKVAPGIYDDMSNADYHKAHGLSKSGLDKMAISPFHYLYNLQVEHTETDAMRVGSALHCLVLEPEKFAKEYENGHGIGGRSAADKQIRAEKKELGITLLNSEDWEAVHAMARNVLAHPAASALLENSISEQSIFVEHPDYNIMCKVRPDIRKITKSGLHIVADLKTTPCAQIDKFQRKVLDYRYYVQDAYYKDVVKIGTGVEVDKFFFIAIDNVAPYCVAVYEADHHMTAVGRLEYMENLVEYAKCFHGGWWPAYGNDYVRLSLPAYKKIKS